MNRILINSIVFFLMVCGVSCTRKITNEDDFYAIMNDPEKGLVKAQNVNGINFTAKYLPVEYLAYKELKNEKAYSIQTRDSILKSYSGSYTFIVKIGPESEEEYSFDIQKFNIENFEEFKQRAMEMNFNISEYLVLNTEFGEFKPVLSTMENVYGLSNHRNIYLVFSPTKENGKLFEASNLDLIFHDEIFNTGIHHFQFLKKDIENIPEVQCWNTII